MGRWMTRRYAGLWMMGDGCWQDGMMDDGLER